MSFYKYSRWGSLTLVLMTACAILWLFRYSDREDVRPFAKIDTCTLKQKCIGMRTDEVVKLLGSPDKEIPFVGVNGLLFIYHRSAADKSVHILFKNGRATDIY